MTATKPRTLTEVRRDLRQSHLAIKQRLGLLERDLVGGRRIDRSALRERIEELENSLELLRIRIDDLDRLEARPTTH